MYKGLFAIAHEIALLSSLLTALDIDDGLGGY